MKTNGYQLPKWSLRSWSCFLPLAYLALWSRCSHVSLCESMLSGICIIYTSATIEVLYMDPSRTTVIAQERSWLSTACAILSTDYETSAEVIFGLSFKWYINICTSFTHLERSIHVLLLQRLFSSIFQSHPSQVLHHPDNHWLQPMSE